MLDDNETPVAWTAVPRDAPVLAVDGSEIGAAEKMLGDLDEDIFHGVALRRKPDGRLVELPASRIKKMTEQRVLTDLAPSEAATLSPVR